MASPFDLAGGMEGVVCNADAVGQCEVGIKLVWVHSRLSARTLNICTSWSDRLQNGQSIACSKGSTEGLCLCSWSFKAEAQSCSCMDIRSGSILRENCLFTTRPRCCPGHQELAGRDRRGPSHILPVCHGEKQGICAAEVAVHKQ